MNIKDLSLLTVTFNNNILTAFMIKSFYKQIGKPKDIIIIDNGTTTPVDPAMKRVFHVIDNTNQRITGDYHQCSKNHCSTIDYALKQIVKTEWVLLVDNDILFKPTAKAFLESFNPSLYDYAGEVGWDDAPPNRLFPYFCLINVSKFNNEHQSYFDDIRCIGPGSKQVGPRGKDTPCWYMDTGCSFYEDTKSNWRLNAIQLDDYIVHMKLTGRANKDFVKFLTANHHLV